MASSERLVDTPAPPGPLGRRERKKLATRDRILDCAVTLFTSRGYDSTTMEDIGECADVARATVFNYFARKEDIVFEWVIRRRARLEEILAEAERQTTDTLSRLRQGLDGLAHLYDEDPATGRAMVRALLRAGGPLLPNFWDTAALLADTIRLGQEQGDIPPDLDAARAGLVIFDAYVGVLYRWVSAEDDQLAVAETMTPAIDLVLSGIPRSEHQPASH